jgi:hypothetical protein
MSYSEDDKKILDPEKHESHPGMDVSSLLPLRFLSSTDSKYYHTLGYLQDIAIDDYDDPNLDAVGLEMAEDDSPYPEVRSAVANTDDPTMPASTLRVWLVGLIWAIILPGVNQFFFFRYPSISIGGVSPLLYSIYCPSCSVISFQIDLSTSLELPPLQGMGSLLTQRYLLRHLSQSRAIHNQGARPYYNHGQCRCWICICRGCLISYII